MHAVWVSLTENAKCRGKLADVVGRQERCTRRCNNSGKAKLDGGERLLAHGKETRIRELVYRAGYTQAWREMHAVWASLTENAKCRGKLADVVGQRERCNRRCNNSKKAKLDGGELVLAHGKKTPIRELVYHAGYTQAQLFELDNGDPSRNIIEIIVRKASMNPSKPSSRITSVLRVKNSIETLERFEKYRENVKKKAKERYVKHPRSMVDGNELLRFYGTTIACCNGESKRVPELCKDSTCRVCRLIQSQFDTEYRLKKGIQLSTSSENTIAVTRANKTKRAVIVCRTIAGGMVNINDKKYEESDSIGNQNLRCITPEYLTVPNPSAVLLCFVIVFDS